MGIIASSLIANVSVTGVEDSIRRLLSMSAASDSVGASLKTLALGGVVIAGAALIGVGVASVKAAADFQQSMTQLVTGAGESQANLKKVGDGILQIAMDTGTSTKQLTAGMYMIESAGFHGAAGLDVLKAAAEGAKAGNAQLATVASAVTTVMTDYSKAHLTATQATNALIATEAAGKTHLEDLARAMGTVLPLASSLGISFPQVAGAMAVMTNAGVTAQRASMNLANAIRSLAAPNAVAVKAMQSVGLSAQELKDTLSTQGLSGAIQLVEQHVGQTFPAGSVQAVEAFKKIMGGAVGYNVALMVGGSHMAAYEANIKSISAAMSKNASDVEGFALVQGNLNLQWDRLREVVEVLGIKLGTVLLPIVTHVLQNVLIPAGQAIATTVIPAFQHLTDVVGKVFASLNEKSILGEGMFSTIARGIERFTSLLRGLSPTWNQVQSAFAAIGEFLVSTFTPVWKQLVDTFNTQVKPAWNDLVTAITPIIPELKIVGQIIGVVLVGALVLLVAAIAGILTAFAGLVKGIIIVFGGIVEIVSGAIQVILGVVAFFVDLFTGHFEKLGGDIARIAQGWIRIFGGVWDVIRGVFIGAIGAIVGWVTGFFSVIWAVVSGFFGGIGQWFTEKFIEARKGITATFGGIGQWFTDRFTEAKNGVTSAFGTLGKWFGDRWNEIYTPLKPVISYIAAVFQTLWNIIVALFGIVGKWFSDRFAEAWKGIITVFTPIGRWFSDRWNEVVKVFSVVGGWFHDRFADAYKAVVDIFAPIGKWFSNRYTDVTNAFSRTGGWFHDRFQEAWNGIVTLFSPIGRWFGDRWNEVMAGVTSFKNQTGDVFTTLKNDVVGIIRGLVNGIVDALNNGISAVEGFVNFFGQGLDSIANALGTQGTIPVAHLGRIPHYASGTEGHPGGAAIVGEKGRELVFLPRGAKVAPHHITEQLLHTGFPHYAGGIGDIASNILSWIGDGAQSILDHVISAMHITAPNLGGMTNIASALFSTVENWAVKWVESILPKFSFGANIPGNVQSWIAAAMALTGVPASWAGALGTIAMDESGGDPHSINLTDSNALAGDPSRGLFQTIMATFAAYALPGHGDIWNPIDNAAAAIEYILARYGTVFNVPGIVSLAHGGPYVGYANGTNYAPGGYGMVGERGPELMYIPRGAQITPNSQLHRGSSPVQVTVNPPPIYLDGRLVASGLLPYITSGIRYATGVIL